MPGVSGILIDLSIVNEGVVVRMSVLLVKGQFNPCSCYKISLGSFIPFLKSYDLRIANLGYKIVHCLSTFLIR